MEGLRVFIGRGSRLTTLVARGQVPDKLGTDYNLGWEGCTPKSADISRISDSGTNQLQSTAGWQHRRSNVFKVDPVLPGRLRSVPNLTLWPPRYISASACGRV